MDKVRYFSGALLGLAALIAACGRDQGPRTRPSEGDGLGGSMPDEDETSTPDDRTPDRDPPLPDCPRGEALLDDQCVTFCEVGQLTCADSAGRNICVDPQSDPEHCGSCEHRCSDSVLCVEGRCQLDDDETCSAQEKNCAGVCLDVQRDAEHCGACDRACPLGVPCVGGKCQVCSEALSLGGPPGVFSARATWGMTLLDWDRDGDLDLLLSDVLRSLGKVPNLGDGTFGQFEKLGATNRPDGLLAVELNGDGLTDVVTYANLNYKDIELWFATEEGDFRRATHELGDSAFPTQIVASDLDADGDMDLLASCRQHQGLAVLINDGTGHFQQTSLDLLDGGYGLAAGDLNGDDYPDAVLAGWSSSEVIFLLGAGDGSFDRVGAYHLGSNLIGTTLLDVTADGQMDVLVGSRAEAVVHLLVGDGAGGVLSTERIELPAGSRFAALVDLTGDGVEELVYVRDDAVGVLQKNLQGPSLFEPLVETPVDVKLASSLFRDIDGDGKVDLLASEEFSLTDDSPAVVMFRGRGDGSFDVPRSAPSGVPAKALRVARDALGVRSLLLALTSDDSALVVYEAGPSGALSEKARFELDAPVKAIETGQFAETPAEEVALLLHDGQLLVLSELATTPQLIQRVELGEATSGILVGDINTDGLDDVLRYTVTSSVVGVMLATDHGPLIENAPVDVGLDIHRAILGDFDGDGDADLIVAGDTEEMGLLFRAPGDGSFGVARDARFAPGLFDLHMVDMNDDGALELITTSDDSSFNGEVLSVIPYGVLIGYGLPDDIVSYGYGTRALRSGDINGDGRTDLILLNEDRGITVIPSEATGWLGAPYLYAAIEVNDVAPFDADLDGDLDLVTGSESGLSVMFNQGPMCGYN